jgi:hypothetical protein
VAGCGAVWPQQATAGAASGGCRHLLQRSAWSCPLQDTQTTCAATPRWVCLCNIALFLTMLPANVSSCLELSLAGYADDMCSHTQVNLLACCGGTQSSLSQALHMCCNLPCFMLHVIMCCVCCLMLGMMLSAITQRYRVSVTRWDTSR